MTEHDRNTLFCASQLLERPADAYFLRIPQFRVLIDKMVQGFNNAVFHLFLDELEQMEIAEALDVFCRAFGQDSETNLCLGPLCTARRDVGSKHNDALNDLYRVCGFEASPVPDHAAHLLKFLSACIEADAQVLLAVYGSGLVRIAQRPWRHDCPYEPLLSAVLDALARTYPNLVRSDDNGKDEGERSLLGGSTLRYWSGSPHERGGRALRADTLSA